MSERKPVYLTANEQSFLASLCETIFNVHRRRGSTNELGLEVRFLVEDWSNIRLDHLYDVFHRTGMNER